MRRRQDRIWRAGAATLLLTVMLLLTVLCAAHPVRAETQAAGTPATASASVSAGVPAAPIADDGGPAGWQGSTSTQPTPQELQKGVSKAFTSINMAWTLLAGFLVMFMQAGFALVETGMCRAKNAADTMFMTFLVYGLGMFGFMVCGFMLMSSGINDTAIGGPKSLG